MDIIITMLNGTSLNLRVHPADTVGSLKTLIQQKLGFAPENQRLTFVNGSTIVLDDDSRSVGSYNLPSGCQVSLLVTQPTPPATIQVLLENEKGKVSTYDIKPDATVNDFKLKIQGREGVPVSQQVLSYQSRVMTDGFTLADYKIEAMSTVNMGLRLRGG